MTATIVTLFVVVTALVALDPAWLGRADLALGRPALELTRHSAALRAWWVLDASLQRPDASRVLLVVIGLVLAGTGRRWAAGWVLLGVLVSLVAAPGVKLLVDRPRPVWADPVVVLTDPSYPSGHATAAWLLATVLVVLWRDHAATLRSRPRRLLATLAAGSVLAAVVVSLDRVFLGVHHPSDVLGGALLGALLALAPRVAMGRVERWCGGPRLADRRHGPGRPGHDGGVGQVGGRDDE